MLRMKDNERSVTQAECSPAKDSYLGIPLKTKMFPVINFQHICICTMCVPNIHGGLEGVRILGTTVISYESPCGAGN